MDTERARFNMIEQQVRPWDVLDQTVLDLLEVVRRETFVPRPFADLAFVDTELPLTIDGVATGESMFSPKVEARLLQELAIRPHERVLEIGAGSGYMAALAAHKGQHVLTIEIHPVLQAFANANLGRAGIRNVDVIGGDGARGWAQRAPFDVIIVSGGLPAIPDELRAQLRVGGRMSVIVGDPPAMEAQIVTRVTDDDFEVENLFETSTRLLRNAWRPNRFRL
ncbi:MAG TPA: protein-L-isoaspartate O-methyltransferase [Burkholderiaceae bacterium]|nr:protein-L-isoaspartate O-methyltransferase [Burkholderiaceae bacterium]